MAVVKQSARCPQCLEPINAGAKRCPHCQSDLAALAPVPKNRLGRLNTFRIGFLCGVAFALIIGLLAYLQFAD
jgi:hypothetical protein